jgi:hypothetical protein
MNNIQLMSVFHPRRSYYCPLGLTRGSTKYLSSRGTIPSADSPNRWFYNDKFRADFRIKYRNGRLFSYETPGNESYLYVEGKSAGLCPMIGAKFRDLECCMNPHVKS